MANKTKNFFKSIMTGLMVATIASASAVAPAAAAGSFSLTILPVAGEDADALRAGMQIFNLLNGAKTNGGVIRQTGFGNGAQMGQNGSGNFGTIWQEGNGHSGNLQQNGNDNAFGIYQFGENTNANVNQYGNGQTGATFIFGF